MYVKGSVVPALAGVQISVIAEKDSPAGGLKTGEIAVSAATGSDGTYVAGPLYDDTTYFSQAALVCTCLFMLCNISLLLLFFSSNLQTNYE
jgi:hypothetical protein